VRIVSFAGEDGLHLGVLADEEVADVTAARPELPRRLEHVLAAGALAALAEAASTAPRRPLSETALRAPVTRPPKFLAIGLNYASHLAELGAAPPEHQTWFNKQSTCVIGHGEAIERPAVSTMLDYEGELGVVIGRRCRHVPRRRAFEVVAGYCCVDDVSVRDWQRRVPTWTLGKSFDTHGPLGPALVTADELDPRGLSLSTYVNGELRQRARTDDLVVDIPAMIEHLSTVFTLEPGDVISTGTPGGVGAAMDPPRWLVPGDRVLVRIEGIGGLENPVVDEPPPEPRIG
jgi:2-keto-4-pentenoate hydratase/2-oxohepta-3-ene-1,7-dioic acid hydratase in catechol pathway